MLEIWPDNIDVWNVWCALRTQWRVVAGLGTAAWQGLDYAAITPLLLDSLGVKEGDRASVFNGLREMEDEAVEWLNAAA